jgi:hypothetical protein
VGVTQPTRRTRRYRIVAGSNPARPTKAPLIETRLLEGYFQQTASNLSFLVFKFSNKKLHFALRFKSFLKCRAC